MAIHTKYMSFNTTMHASLKSLAHPKPFFYLFSPLAISNLICFAVLLNSIGVFFFFHLLIIINNNKNRFCRCLRTISTLSINRAKCFRPLYLYSIRVSNWICFCFQWCLPSHYYTVHQQNQNTPNSMTFSIMTRFSTKYTTTTTKDFFL